jgi:hypothetical protein
MLPNSRSVTRCYNCFFSVALPCLCAAAARSSADQRSSAIVRSAYGRGAGPRFVVNPDWIKSVRPPSRRGAEGTYNS